MRISSSLLFAYTLLLFTGCGGTGNNSVSSAPTPVPTPAPNATPTIAALSPNSSTIGGPGFTLSLVGSNFIPGSTVQWNGSNLPPTLVSSQLITADVPATSLSAPGPDAVTVVNPAPGGGLSNSMSFTVPCVIPAPAPASTQTRSRLGAYYFDGWSGPLTNFHFAGLPLGPFQDREPLSGWQDNSQCSVEQQLAVAHNFGIDFFVFDWYFNTAVNDTGEDLNSALKITHSLADRHGMQFAILYVDSGPFIAGPADWTSTINEWVGYMTDPAYVLVNGKPLLVVIDMSAMRQAFGSSTAVVSAFNQLRAAAVAHGLSGVYVAGGFPTGYDHNTQSGYFPDLSMAVADGYDAVTIYNSSFGTVKGAQPFSVLSEAGHWIWGQGALKSPLPFIPVAMDGWDPRPWNEGNVWFNRSPQEVSAFVSDAMTWADSNPTLRPEPSPSPPLVLIEAWNEFGEGSHLLPTAGEGTSYGDALAAMLQAVAVLVSPDTATVQASSTEQLIARVSNDSSNQGVSWTVSCPSASCGAVFPASTSNGTATIYTAPTSLPAPGITITVTATSVADRSKSSSATLIPVGHIPRYEAGVDYHSTGVDNDVSGFIAVYDQPLVRQKVQIQLQGMADRGATFIHTSMWVAKPPGPPCCANTQITFPMTDQEAANLHAYAQDVAGIQSAGGTRLRLDLALMWGGSSDYTVGNPTTGLGSPPISAMAFASFVQTTIDQVVNAVKGVARPDSVPVVDTIFFDPEVMIGAKANEDWFLAINYPRFVSVVSAAGFRAAVYFLASCDQKYVLDDTWIDPDYPILNGHASMFWIYRSTKFLADNGLPLPSRIDFSCYMSSTGASYDQLFQRVLDDADATLPSLGASRLYGVAETNYLDDPALRVQYAQAFAKQAAQNPRMLRVSFWPNGPGGGQNGSAYPFTIEDFLPVP